MSSCTRCHGVGVHHTSASCPILKAESRERANHTTQADTELQKQLAEIIECCPVCGTDVPHACTGILTSNSKLARLMSIVEQYSDTEVNIPDGVATQADAQLRKVIRQELFWITRGTLQMAENIRLNSEEDEINVTFGKLDEQYYHQQYGEDDGSYRTQESEDALVALFQAAQQQLLTELMSHKDQLLTWKKDDGSEVVYVPLSILKAKLKELRDGENASNG